MVGKFAIADASFDRSPGQMGNVFVADLVDRRPGPIKVGYGLYGPDQRVVERYAINDVMVVLEGRLSVSAGAKTVTAGPGEIIRMPKGNPVTIASHEHGAVTAYVNGPDCQEAGAAAANASAGQASSSMC